MIMISIGDKVKIKNHPNEITGRVVRRIADQSLWPAICEYKFVVEFDDEKLIPPTMEYSEDHLIVIDKEQFSFGPKCECGAKFTSYKDLHMQYCPKYKKL